jgi:hypothetical protein
MMNTGLKGRFGSAQRPDRTLAEEMGEAPLRDHVHTP